MNIRKKAVFNWSGGKDSALALYNVLQQNEFEVVALLTTVNEETELSYSIITNNTNKRHKTQKNQLRK